MEILQHSNEHPALFLGTSGHNSLASSYLRPNLTVFPGILKNKSKKWPPPRGGDGKAFNGVTVSCALETFVCKNVPERLSRFAELNKSS